MYRINLLILIFIFSVTQLMAAEEESILLDEVVVTAAKLEELVGETTSAVTVIKDEDIKKMNVEFVPDILRTIPELNVVQNGGVGKEATVLLRGGKSAHTLVLIDGIKVNSTTTGSFDFSGINVDEIERIEIVKGPQSTIYGSEAIAGVINIITKKGEGALKIDASIEGGSFDTFKSSATVLGGDKNVHYRLTGNYTRTDGISAAKEGEERDGYRNASVTGKLGISPKENFEIEFTGQYSYDKSELDGFDFISGPVDDLNFVQHENNLLLSGKGTFYLSDIWEQIFTVSRVLDSLRLRDPDTAFNNADITINRVTIDWQHNVYVSDDLAITAGGELRKESGENEGSFDRSIDNRAAYINNKLTLFDDNLILNAGLRYDDHETFGNETTYRFGAVYKINPISARIKGSYGTGFRSPSFNELFFPLFGKEDLEPEESKSWEIGLEKDMLKDRLNISLTYFNQKYRDLIEVDPLTFTAANIADAKVRGVEVDALLKLTDNININTGYTYLDSEDKDTGQRLHLRPIDKFNISTEVFIKDVFVIADYVYVGKRFDNSVSQNLSSYSLVNLAGNYKLRTRLTLFAKINNLFDEDYEELGGFSTPGISAFGGMRISL